MKKLLAALLILAAPCSAQLSGKLDTTPDFAIGTWQSVRSADQAFGVAKHVWSLNYGANAVLNVGLFAGAQKPLLSEPGTAARPVAGPTFAVPGSTLDWALGTNWGAQWVPDLKTGVLVGYDFSRPKALSIVPGFVGVGAAYSFTVGTK